MSVQTLAESSVNFANLLDRVEDMRLHAYERLDPGKRGQLGQYFTSASLASFMADFFDPLPKELSVLDPGAGTGMPTAAFVLHALSQNSRPRRISVTAYEVDSHLIPFLRKSMSLIQELCQWNSIEFSAEIIADDFIKSIPPCLESGPLFDDGKERFDCVIMNPPYKKITGNSAHRRILSGLGLRTVNLYTGFLWLAAKDLKPGGQLVSIQPRSFTNGPYYRPFRKAFFDEVGIDRVHIFNSRTSAFQEDEILQESVILHAVKRPMNDLVRITVSDHLGDPPKERFISSDDFCDPTDPDLFVHLITDEYDQHVRSRMKRFTHSLLDLGISVSTGRVVDFRAVDFLQQEPDSESVPLIYPGHCRDGLVVWPRDNFRKCNWFRRSPASESQLVPAGDYVLVRRFTAKEEKRRISASLISPSEIPAPVYAFENHLNYFHQAGGPLEKDLAKGLAVFLNSTFVDAYFRQFNGHTQVNATDLRSLCYPNRDQLIHMGSQLVEQLLNTEAADVILDSHFLPMSETNSQQLLLVRKKIEDALDILKQLDVPREQQNERSALTLLALAGHTPKTKWKDSGKVFLGITQMMDWFRDHFGVSYAPNTRETVRRQTVHQFVEMGLVIPNPDQPDRPVNSPYYGYEIEPSALELIQTYRTRQWKTSLRTYRENIDTLRALHHQERKMNRLEV